MRERLVLSGGDIVLIEGVMHDGVVVISGGKINGISHISEFSPCESDRVIDCSECFICPGFIDLHNQGGGGFTVMDGSREHIFGLARTHAAHGTTGLLLTPLIERNSYCSLLPKLAETVGKNTGGASILGIHAEGPFVNPERKGCMPLPAICVPDNHVFAEIIELGDGKIVEMTIAPELPGALDLILKLAQDGIIASLGHSNATLTDVLRAIDHGASHVTHFLNAMSPIHQREPGLAGAALYSTELTVEVIADGFHIHPWMLGLIVQNKSVNLTCLITDAMSAMGFEDGIYESMGQKVTLKNERLSLAYDPAVLAGSVLSMDRAVAGMINMVGLPLTDAVTMASTTPAAVLGLQNRKGRLETGFDADIAVLDRLYHNQMTIVNGRIVYETDDPEKKMSKNARVKTRSAAESREAQSRGMLKCALIVGILAFSIYINNLGHDWAYDDHQYITENEFVNNPSRIGDIFTTTYLYGSRGLQTGLYRPITVFSYALNSAATGLRPSWFHLCNNLIHTANSVLVFLMLTAFLGRSDISFFAALLFAVHPVHTESVTNVVGRAELLAFLFVMLSLSMYRMKSVNRMLPYFLSLVFFMFALMSKEIPAVLPFIILLVVIGDHIRGGQKDLKKGVLETAGFFITLLLYMIIRYAVIRRCGPVPDVMFADNPIAGLPFMERLPTALSVINRYILLLLFPLKLSADYSYNQIPMVDLPGNVMAVIGLLMLFLLVIVGIMSARRSFSVYFGILFLGLPFLVISNIFFTTGTIMGERLMYMPSLGFTLLFAAGILWFFQKVTIHPRYAVWTVLFVTLLYSGRTLARNQDWKNNSVIFTKTSQTSPNSVKASYNYALVLRREGRLEEAIAEYRHAVSIWPGHQRAWYNLGNTLSDNKQFAQSVEAYKRALEILPTDLSSLHNLAMTYKHLNEPEKAVETFEKILEHSPRDLSTRLNIGNTWVEFKEYDRALKVFEENVRINPREAGSLANIGNIYYIKGDTLAAEEYYQRAINTDPVSPNPHNSLLGLLIAQNRIEEAEEKIRAMREENIPIRQVTINKFLDLQKK